MKCPGLHCPGCGEGGGQVLAVAAAAVVVLELAEWMFARLWWLLAVTAAAFAIALYVVWRIMRWQERREAAWGAQRAAQLAAQPVQALPRTGRPAITGGVTLNFYNLSQAEQAEVIRKAVSDAPQG
jgi:hypothetical protein